MWRLLQTLLIFGVLASNIHYQWTPNGYVATLIAIGVAYFATVTFSWAYDRWPRKQR
jgi:hypothetical protein